MKSCRNCKNLFVNKDDYYDCEVAEKDDDGIPNLTLCFSWEPVEATND